MKIIIFSLLIQINDNQQNITRCSSVAETLISSRDSQHR